MNDELKIIAVELHEFRHDMRDWVPSAPAGALRNGWALRILTGAGVAGEYVTDEVETAAHRRWAPSLLGKSALERENIYHDLKRLLRQHARLGVAPVDIALWDLAGKLYGCPIWQFLGGWRTRLPAYASRALGDGAPGGLDCPEAYADFAEQCLSLGYRAYKIHTWWNNTDIRRDIATMHAVAKRVGGKMDLMLDPACGYATYADALRVGRACDDHGFFWYEDPFQDGGVAHLAHRRLRESIKTPLLQGEHVRGLEDRVNFMIAGATDLIRGDPFYEGITATMKLAHAAEGLGLDIELHVGGLAAKHCMAAIRNSNYFELGLVHPKVKRGRDPIYGEDCSDGRLEDIGADGCVSVPQGPGLGIRYDWDFIAAHRTALITYPQDRPFHSFPAAKSDRQQP